MTDENPISEQAHDDSVQIVTPPAAEPERTDTAIVDPTLNPPPELGRVLQEGDTTVNTEEVPSLDQVRHASKRHRPKLRRRRPRVAFPDQNELEPGEPDMANADAVNASPELTTEDPAILNRLERQVYDLEQEVLAPEHRRNIAELKATPPTKLLEQRDDLERRKAAGERASGQTATRTSREARSSRPAPGAATEKTTRASAPPRGEAAKVNFWYQPRVRRVVVGTAKVIPWLIAGAALLLIGFFVNKYLLEGASSAPGLNSTQLDEILAERDRKMLRDMKELLATQAQSQPTSEPAPTEPPPTEVPVPQPAPEPTRKTRMANNFVPAKPQTVITTQTLNTPGGTVTTEEKTTVTPVSSSVPAAVKVEESLDDELQRLQREIEANIVNKPSTAK